MLSSPGNGAQICAPKSVPPSPELAEYVRAYQYWETSTGRGAHPYAISVLPLLTFYLGARCPAFEYVAGRTRLLPAVIALGACDHRVADVMPIGHQKNFTVLFEPTGFYRLFRILRQRFETMHTIVATFLVVTSAICTPNCVQPRHSSKWSVRSKKCC